MSLCVCVIEERETVERRRAGKVGAEREGERARESESERKSERERARERESERIYDETATKRGKS